MDYDVIIVGGGIMGCATAYNLTKMGKRVLLIDQFKIKEAFNQSQDYSRFFRCAYGNDIFYAKLAAKSLLLWKALEKESKEKLYIKTGCLILSNQSKKNVLDNYLTLKKLGYQTEMLDVKELRHRFPQFNAKYGVLDHSGGILSASKAIDVFLSLAKKRGLKVMDKTRVIGISGNAVLLEGSGEIHASKIIVTAGFWINKLLKGKYQIKTTRQEIIYIKPSKQRLFKPDKFPIFMYDDKGHFYGIPIHGINAVKVAVDSTVPDDPQKLKDSGNFKSVESLRKLTKHYIPKLATGKVVKKKFCMYDMSHGQDFIIDELSRNVIVATGFSGHGFKFAPVIGKILADLTVKGRTHYDMSRWRK